MTHLRLDPTRTTTLRKQFNSALAARFNLFRKELQGLLIKEDAFGLKKPRAIWFGPTSNKAATTLDVSTKLVRKTVKSWQKQIDSTDLLDVDDHPHITVRYGFKDSDKDRVKGLLGQHNRVYLKFGGLSLFENEDGDVLKVDVESNQLNLINRHLGIVPSPQSYQVYNPHMTVAYLKSGTGHKYLGMRGLEGVTVLVDHVVWSDSSKNISSVVLNQSWAHLPEDKRIDELKKWLKFRTGQLFLKHDLQDSLDSWLGTYTQQAYQRGLKRSYDDWKKPTGVLLMPKEAGAAFEKGRAAEFMRQSFGGPTPIEKMRRLAARTYDDIQGVTEKMSHGVLRVLLDGVANGLGPREIGVELNKTVNIYKRQGTAIARTEIIRGFNEGALDGLDNLGATAIGVMVEWTTSGMGMTKLGNPSPCPKCAPLANLVLTVKEARGMLPRHPNCLCSYVPANVGEKTTKQVRDAKRIHAAIKASARGDARWIGQRKKITSKRPKVSV